MDELIKIAIVAIAAPIWWPFLQAIREELQDLFAPDGGMLGETPSPRRRQEIEDDLGRRPPKVVHEWIANRRPESAARQAGRAPAPARQAPRPTRIATRSVSQRSSRR